VPQLNFSAEVSSKNLQKAENKILFKSGKHIFLN